MLLAGFSLSDGARAPKGKPLYLKVDKSYDSIVEPRNAAWGEVNAKAMEREMIIAGTSSSRDLE